jgi:hypothetical protein
MVVLGPKALAAVCTFHPVELGRISQLEGQAHLHRSRTSPAADMTEILAVVEHSGEKGVVGDLSGCFG